MNSDLWWFLSWTISLVDVAISVLASAHVILTKQDTRASIGWIGLIWLSPILGSILYVLLGINRINRKARSLRPRPRPSRLGASGRNAPTLTERLAEQVGETAADDLSGLAELVGRLTETPLNSGNAIAPLIDGDEAYPAMLEAIESATRSVSLCTYIFKDDLIGDLFVDALVRAMQRGVAVRVLIDDLGSRYGLPPMPRRLRREGVPVATFLPTLGPGWWPYLNLRNHRKVLVADGQVGFTGGMNRDAEFLHGRQTEPDRCKHDLHFRLAGPVVADLQRVFADDWLFVTGERLEGEAWFPAEIASQGPMLARGIADGPDHPVRILSLTIQAALACARREVTIVTPYFLPDAALISALEVAAMRGVRVDILVPRANNLTVVRWASMPLMAQVLEGGCRVWWIPPPFDHSKILLVDSAWTLLGSANWDPRSLRLNFEFNVECYSPDMARRMSDFVRAKMACAVPLTLHDIRRQSLPVRLRDGVARLFSPYL